MRRSPARCARGAFTLLELLATMAIVGGLLALVIGAVGHAQETAKRARAKAELGAIAAALEAYRRAHGDYPHTADAAELLRALTGQREPDGTPAARRASIDLAHFTVAGGTGSGAEPEARLLDPWDRPYRYVYKSGGPAAWRLPGFVLYSTGGDGAEVAPDAASGFFDPLGTENADNVYADR